MAYLDKMINSLPESERARKIELLGRIAVIARNMEPLGKLIWLSRTSMQFDDLGKREKAKTLVDELLKLEAGLPSMGRAVRLILRARSRAANR